MTDKSVLELVIFIANNYILVIRISVILHISVPLVNGQITVMNWQHQPVC